LNDHFLASKEICALFSVLDNEYSLLSDGLNEYVTNNCQLLTFPNTVRLRLSLKKISDLAFIIQCDTLPRIEYLHVTLEDLAHISYQLCNRSEYSSCSTLCPKDFSSSQAHLPYLRILHLQQVSISDVIILIQYLSSMSQLESLILVNCDVKGMYSRDLQSGSGPVPGTETRTKFFFTGTGTKISNWFR
jgi:hypothetical protein